MASLSNVLLTMCVSVCVFVCVDLSKWLCTVKKGDLSPLVIWFFESRTLLCAQLIPHMLRPALSAEILEPSFANVLVAIIILWPGFTFRFFFGLKSLHFNVVICNTPKAFYKKNPLWKMAIHLFSKLRKWNYFRAIFRFSFKKNEYLIISHCIQ